MGRQRAGKRRTPFPPPPPPASPTPLVAILAAALAILAAYGFTLGSTVAHGDSGELIAVCHTLGVAHPPGYPLYTLLGKLATLLPLGTIAWRVSLLSALCGAAAAFFVARAVGRLTGRVGPALIAGGMLAFSPLVWPYAVTAEVFALNNLFVAVLLDLTTRSPVETRGVRRLLLAVGFVFALGLTNHHVLLLLAGPVVVCQAIAQGAALAGGRARAAWLLTLAIGLVPYLYLFVAPALGSEIVWGDTATIEGVLRHVLRSDYGTLQLASGVPAVSTRPFDKLAAFLAAFSSGTLWLGPPLVLAAAPWLWRASAVRPVLQAWSCGLAAYLVVFATLANLSLDDPIHAAVLSRFWQQGVVVLAFAAGLGLAEIGRLLPPARASRLGLAFVGVAVPALLCAVHLAAADQRDRVFFRDYGRAILEPLPANAILVAASDEAIGAVRFLQQVEGLRRDVRVLPAGQLASPWFRKLARRRMPELRFPQADEFTFREFLDLNLPRARVFLVNRVPWEQTLEAAYAPWTSGLADEVLAKGVSPALAPWVDQARVSFELFPKAEAGRDGPWERYVEGLHRRQVERFATSVATVAARDAANPVTARQVVRALEPLARTAAPPPVVLRNLGVAHQLLVSVDPGARVQMISCFRRHLALAPESAPDRALIQRAVAEAERASSPDGLDP